MKFLVIFIAAVVCIVGVNLLIPAAPKSAPDEIPELVIRAYSFKENVTDPNLPEEEGFVFAPLEVGKPHLLAPIINSEVFNLCFSFEFDGGIIEVVSESGDTQLSVASSKNPFGGDDLDHRIFGDKLKLANDGYMNLNPFGSGVGYHTILDESQNTTGYVGREHYLTVNAYELSNENSPVISARIKLVQLDDKAKNTVYSGSSRFYSAELVSYELSEMYAIKYSD